MSYNDVSSQYETVTKRKILKMDKHLPKIVLPKQKLKMFADWWNSDIRFEKTVPHSIEEGYLIIENDSQHSIEDYASLIKITAKECHSTYRFIESQLKEFLEITKQFIVYFKFAGQNRIIAETYTLDNKQFSNTEAEIGGEKPEKELILDENQLKNCTRRDDILHMFNYRNLAFLITCLWYMATTAPSKRYVYEEKSPVISGRKKGVVQVSDTKFIVTPVYDLTKIRTVTIERLMTRKKGWTYSHSFQVHGHYRHYKNGKTIFIQPFIKGKGKPFKAQTTVLDPIRIKEE